MKWIFPIGISMLFWGIVGFVRYVTEKKSDQPKLSRKKLKKMISQVAICVPAHNEELVIKKTIRALKKLVSPAQIYVVSDGSTDATASIAKSLGRNVLELNPGLGKAGALEAIIKKFRLFTRYKFILIVDADTIFPKSFLRKALPAFKHKQVAAVTAYAKTKWYPDLSVNQKLILVSYRTRLWRLIQWFFTFGQTWRYTNVLPVIPGYASLYRVSALKKLKIEIPGIAIEDFNMAFQLHKKKLGIIAHHPSIYATTQEPSNFGDYWKQVQRWNVGYLQTIKYWKIWPSFFWVSLGVFIIEIIIGSIFYLLLPILILLLLSLIFSSVAPSFLIAAGRYIEDNYIVLVDLFVLVFLFDYLLSLLVAYKDKKFMIVFYGLGFTFIRFIDALIFLVSIPKAFTQSSGRWESPDRTK